MVGFLRQSSATDAFITLDGIMTDLNLFLPAGSDCELLLATSINDAREIIGIGRRNGRSPTRASCSHHRNHQHLLLTSRVSATGGDDEDH